VTAAPSFGTAFTDHMAVSTWRRGVGWAPVEVVPVAATGLHPAAAVLHYGQSIFEGAKAFRNADGSIHLFRVADHAARMARSARRMAMPELGEDQFIEALVVLVSRDAGHLGAEPGSALYLRPFMIATDARLGAATPPDTFQLTVIASPTPAVLPVAVSSRIRVWVCDEYVRACLGGTGNMKTAANYALSMLGQADARERDCNQAVWLDAIERRWVEELGAMNLFFVYGQGAQARLVTPPLGDTVLAGITRDTVIRLASELSIPVEQHPVSIEDWQGGCERGEITEVFATGTASGIKLIGEVCRGMGCWSVGAANLALSR
jgi:branched-chain amino acid aminotransferase